MPRTNIAIEISVGEKYNLITNTYLVSLQGCNNYLVSPKFEVDLLNHHLLLPHTDFKNDLGLLYVKLATIWFSPNFTTRVITKLIIRHLTSGANAP